MFLQICSGFQKQGFSVCFQGLEERCSFRDTGTGVSHKKHRQRCGKLWNYKGRGCWFWKMRPRHRPLRPGLQTKSSLLGSVLLAAPGGPQRRGGEGGHLGRDHLTRRSFRGTWHFSEKLPGESAKSSPFCLLCSW